MMSTTMLRKAIVPTIIILLPLLLPHTFWAEKSSRTLPAEEKKRMSLAKTIASRRGYL
jgi:hypothetical protein